MLIESERPHSGKLEWATRRTLLWLTACFCTLITPLPDFGQNSNKDEWGHWRYTWEAPKDTSEAPKYWSAILFRSKCISDSGGDSKWGYQFRSRYDAPVDFVAREEHGVDGATTNELSRPEAFTLEGGALSPVFEAQLHGTCEKFRELKMELKIEVICVTGQYRSGEVNDPCFQDENGKPLEFKGVPDHPRYQ